MALEILAADIGGTSSRFGHFVDDGSSLSLKATATLATADYGSGLELIAALAASGFPLPSDKADRIVLAVAGPVRDGKATLTSRGWDVDGRAVASLTGTETDLINDLVAQAWATRSPLASALETVLPGRVEEGAVEAVIAPGTGLGKAFVVPDGRGRVFVLPSEGGHETFPVEGADEADYVRFLCSRVGERGKETDFVVSGRGLPHLQAYLYGEELDERSVVDSLGRSPLTVEWMARFLGRICRDTALNVLATGGVILAGGVVGRSPRLVSHRVFERSFRQSPTMASLLESIPVRLLAREESGLWGAAQAAREKGKKKKEPEGS
ncbi:MAG: glucokinase [Synergistaceae bacterium]|nr:glucokinase [Synergistaceae bacterium]